MEGAAGHVLVGELDVDHVGARQLRRVVDLADAVVQVVAADVHLGRALDGQSEAAVPGLARVHHEAGGLLGVDFLHSLAVHLDLGRVADLRAVDHDPERGFPDVAAPFFHRHPVLAYLFRRERNSCENIVFF